MSLKIIGGEYGGRVLRTVRGLGTRPLLGQVRESLFNILADQIEGAFVWDLFAGTGASGIEALSRGAARALFVEKNHKALETLRQNLALLGDDAVARAVVLRADAWDPPVMHRAAFGAARDDRPDDAASDAEVPPDLVFLDPPYAMVAEDPVKSMARARRLLDRTAPRGCVVFHFEVGMLDEDDFDRDLDLDLREWGSTAVALLWRKGEAPERLQRRWAKDRAAPDR
ncbi:MAG: RsmD family RNA methyltransferase [Planctomycetes bacterium]|nr:RsmD family RNA methyltransferase [Planctomycetota bacterium]